MTERDRFNRLEGRQLNTRERLGDVIEKVIVVAYAEACEQSGIES